MNDPIRFVTPEEFREIHYFADGKRFPRWFGLSLRAMFATGCRPAEVVGTKGREGRFTRRDGSKYVSRIKAHHGLRACDVLPNHRLQIAGKNTNPHRRTTELKPRIVLCADDDVYRELRALADETTTRYGPTANLFCPVSANGKNALGYWLRLLKPMLPTRLRGFSPRWLRHSHAIAAIRAGVDLVSIQRQLGHEDLGTTAIYLRFAGMDEGRYLAAFGGSASAELVGHSCPSCGFGWKEDAKSGALSLDSRIGSALRRRVGVR